MFPSDFRYWRGELIETINETLLSLYYLPRDAFRLSLACRIGEIKLNSHPSLGQQGGRGCTGDRGSQSTAVQLDIQVRMHGSTGFRSLHSARNIVPPVAARAAAKVAHHCLSRSTARPGQLRVRSSPERPVETGSIFPGNILKARYARRYSPGPSQRDSAERAAPPIARTRRSRTRERFSPLAATAAEK